MCRLIQFVESKYHEKNGIEVKWKPQVKLNLIGTYMNT